MYSNTFVQCKDQHPILSFSHIALDELKTSFRVFKLELGNVTYQFSMDNDQYVDLLIHMKSLLDTEIDRHRHQEGSFSSE
jgi:hypothetical protein